MADRIRVYFGHALTNATAEYREERELARQTLEKHLAFEVLRFIGLTEGGPGDVFDCDIIQCVGGADIFVCDFTIDSNGTGAEFNEAVRVRGIPGLALYDVKARASRLIQGFGVRIPELVNVERYTSIVDELLPLLIEKVKRHPHLQERFQSLV